MTVADMSSQLDDLSNGMGGIVEMEAAQFYGAFGIGLLLILGLLIFDVRLNRQKRMFQERYVKESILVKRLQSELREKQRELMKKPDAPIQRNPVISEIQRVKETGYNMLSDRVNKMSWDRVINVRMPEAQVTPDTRKLTSERDDLRQMLEVAKIKYQTKELDEKAYNSINEGYQKRLIELESKLLRLQGKGVESMMRDDYASQRLQEGKAASGEMDESINEMIEAKLGGKEDNRVVLVSSKSETHAGVVTGILNTLVKRRGMGGVYICVSQPSEVIMAAMAASGISAEDMFFIDCISFMAGKTTPIRTDKVMFIENPSSLEEIIMHLNRLLPRVETKKRFLFLDSLSSLLIYNDEKGVKEFTHFLINKIRLESVTGIILSIEKKEAEDLIRTLTPMCDTEMRF